MNLKTNWRPGEKYSADSANAVAAAVNQLVATLAQWGPQGELLAAAVQEFVDSARHEFATTPVPLDPDNPNTLWQWVDKTGAAVGEPVPFSEIMPPSLAAAAVEAAAPDVVRDWINEHVGDSHIFFDTDGVPYFEAELPGGEPVLPDADGVPYMPTIGA